MNYFDALDFSALFGRPANGKRKHPTRVIKYHTVTPRIELTLKAIYAVQVCHESSAKCQVKVKQQRCWVVPNSTSKCSILQDPETMILAGCYKPPTNLVSNRKQIEESWTTQLLKPGKKLDRREETRRSNVTKFTDRIITLQLHDTTQHFWVDV